ncbi:MAG TPA: thioredoxin family protein [Dehalococcoidia bacterium]|nr:thioredoxin family protein [Dehalococcoidia bacterium]
MTTGTTSVVTAERFAQGIDYKTWMEQIDRNQQRFVENYEGFNPDPADIERIRSLVARGATKCLALGEAWCPDVFRGLPVIAKVAEQTGMELRIFFRDQNLDIMNEFLKRGEFQSIPTLVFYTDDMKYLGHWIERAQKAVQEMPQLTAISSKLRDPEISQEDRQKYMAEYAAFQNGPVWRGWQHAQVKEIIELLEKALDTGEPVVSGNI